MCESPAAGVVHEHDVFANKQAVQDPRRQGGVQRALRTDLRRIPRFAPMTSENDSLSAPDSSA